MEDGKRKFESDSLSEAYFDRNQAAMLAACFAEELRQIAASFDLSMKDIPVAGWRENPDDPSWPILFIELPGLGQISWHIPSIEAVDFGVSPYYKEWDGHDLEEKRARIDKYLRDW